MHILQLGVSPVYFRNRLIGVFTPMFFNSTGRLACCKIEIRFAELYSIMEDCFTW